VGGKGNSPISKSAFNNKTESFEVINRRHGLVVPEDRLSVIFIGLWLDDKQVLETTSIFCCITHFFYVLQTSVREWDHVDRLILRTSQEVIDGGIWVNFEANRDL
jgi:hypothetical protein